MIAPGQENSTNAEARMRVSQLALACPLDACNAA
jgi:hypothetical protein